MASYFWPPCRQPQGLAFLHKDLEALQRLVAKGLLTMELAVEVLDGPWFARQVPCSRKRYT